MIVLKILIGLCVFLLSVFICPRLYNILQYKPILFIIVDIIFILMLLLCLKIILYRSFKNTFFNPSGSNPHYFKWLKPNILEYLEPKYLKDDLILPSWVHMEINRDNFNFKKQEFRNIFQLLESRTKEIEQVEFDDSNKYNNGLKNFVWRNNIFKPVVKAFMYTFYSSNKINNYYDGVYKWTQFICKMILLVLIVYALSPTLLKNISNSILFFMYKDTKIKLKYNNILLFVIVLLVICSLFVLRYFFYLIMFCFYQYKLRKIQIDEDPGIFEYKIDKVGIKYMKIISALQKNHYTLKNILDYTVYMTITVYIVFKFSNKIFSAGSNVDISYIMLLISCIIVPVIVLSVIFLCKKSFSKPVYKLLGVIQNKSIQVKRSDIDKIITNCNVYLDEKNETMDNFEKMKECFINKNNLLKELLITLDHEVDETQFKIKLQSGLKTLKEEETVKNGTLAPVLSKTISKIKDSDFEDDTINIEDVMKDMKKNPYILTILLKYSKAFLAKELNKMNTTVCTDSLTYDMIKHDTNIVIKYKSFIFERFRFYVLPIILACISAYIFTKLYRIMNRDKNYKDEDMLKETFALFTIMYIMIFYYLENLNALDSLFALKSLMSCILIVIIAITLMGSFISSRLRR